MHSSVGLSVTAESSGQHSEFPLNSALILGVTGQDGITLSKYLCDLGYEVIGTSRDPNAFSRSPRSRFLDNRVRLVPLDFRDPAYLTALFRELKPSEIYNLAGLTSVAESFADPIKSFESIVLCTSKILNGVRHGSPDSRFFNACSSECFGGVTTKQAANEDTPFRPSSPYAIAKADVFWQVRIHREAYSMFACSGILGNHESVMRADHFVTKKIVRAAVEIKRGHREFLELGNISISRDWGWAEDYVQCMHAMLNATSAADYVIATGTNHTLIQFLQRTFSHLGLDWETHVRVSQSEMRPLDVVKTSLDPSRVKRELGWSSRTSFEEIVEKMIEFELGRDAIL